MSGGVDPSPAAAEPMGEPSAVAADWREELPTRSGGLVAAGVALFAAFAGAFVVWAVILPLHSAVVVPGKLVPGGLHQKVQHQGGGRVVAIRARDGAQVERGEAIVVLDPVTDRAEMTRLRARRARLAAARARLDAELRGRPAPYDLFGTLALRADAPDAAPASQDAAGSSDPERLVALGRLRGVAPALRGAAAPEPEPEPISDRWSGDLIDAQMGEYRAGRRRLERELEGLERQRAALGHQREGARVQAEAQRDLAAMARDELRRIAPLARSGYVARSRMREIERTIAETDARATALAAEGRGFDERIAELDARIDVARTRDREAVSEELTQVLGELGETNDALRAARDAVDRSVVRAPVAGTVVKMMVGTVGGVVASGDVIAEIVPRGVGLVAEGRVRPSDIADVSVGQTAEVVVTAHDRNAQPPLEARVVYVAADTQRDGDDGDPYYLVRLELAPGAAPMLAGMQAELYLHSHPRTFLDYVMEPLTDSFRRAFQER